MGDDYQDIVELGIEGVGHLTDRYHDAVYGLAGKHKPRLPHWHKKNKEDAPPPPRDPPPQHSQDRSVNQRARSAPRRDRYDSNSDSDSGRKDWEDRRMYGASAPDRRRDSGHRDDGGYERTEEEREYYGYSPRASQQVAVRDRDPYRSSGALAARPPSPPPYGYPEAYGDAWAARGRPMPSRQRSSSWSPPRRSDQRSHHSPPRRVRSKSPNHHRVVATIVGALAGGVAGSRMKQGEELPNKVSTVAGALIGGLGARELEKVYDRHKEKRYQEEEREEERRERRRERRERRYS